MSSKLFGNEKLVEVVRALAAEAGVATTQLVARRTGIDHSLARDVLRRLAEAKVVTPLPRANSRAPQYYEVDKSNAVWLNLLSLANAIAETWSEKRSSHRSDVS